MKWFFVNVVWGEEYVSTFLNLSLPNQLSPENFGCVRSGKYLLYTTKEDLVEIQKSVAFLKLLSYIPVEIIYIEVNSVGIDKFKVLNDCHKHAIQLAGKTDSAIVFLSPDILLSCSAFKELDKILQTGSRAVLVASIRLDREGISGSLIQANREGRYLSASELAKVAFKNLHPYSKNLFWGEGKTTCWPSHLYWFLGPEHILVRAFHLHPLVVYPEHKGAAPSDTIDGRFLEAACSNKSSYTIIDNARKIAVFEVSKKEAFSNLTSLRPNIFRLCFWALKHASKLHRCFVREHIIISPSLSDPDLGKVKRSDELVNAILFFFKAYFFPIRLGLKLYWCINRICAFLRRRSFGLGGH